MSFCLIKITAWYTNFTGKALIIKLMAMAIILIPKYVAAIKQQEADKLLAL
ncbi:MAG: hypothetical protein O4807_10785 [Trichodesmium sp. St19_bin2]|nr:hypothetical protein [Trichodesmium sp. St19_bin2]